MSFRSVTYPNDVLDQFNVKMTLSKSGDHMQNLAISCVLQAPSKARSDSPDREKDQGNGNFSRRKETLSMSFVTEDSNFFQLLGYIFSAFKRHDTNHAILKYSPFSKKLTYISMPLVSASY